jgi:hypothetical protein
VVYTIPPMTVGLCQWTMVRPQPMEPEICFVTNVSSQIYFVTIGKNRMWRKWMRFVSPEHCNEWIRDESCDIKYDLKCKEKKVIEEFFVK